MAEDDGARPLSEDERAELEELRREKAARQRAERARRERAELEELRAEKRQAQGERAAQAGRTRPTPAAQPARTATRTRRVRTVSPEEAAQIERDREVRARNAKLMEPDDDLSMPIGQKVVLVAIFVVASVAVLAMVFGPR